MDDEYVYFGFLNGVFVLLLFVSVVLVIISMQIKRLEQVVLIWTCSYFAGATSISYTETLREHGIIL